MTENVLETLLASDHVSPATRRVLRERLGPDTGWPKPRVFTDRQRETILAVALRLVPEVDGLPRPDLAKAFEHRLAAPEGKGWRYANLPSDLDAQRALLDHIESESGSMFDQPYEALTGAQQDDLLSRLQGGASTAPLDVTRAFEDMLAVIAECYASDPAVLVAIGYVGFADLPRWERVGLNQRDVREITTESTKHDG